MSNRSRQNRNLIARSLSKSLLLLGSMALSACGFGTSSKGLNNADQLPGIGDIVPFPAPGGSGGTQPSGTFPILSFKVRGVGYNPAETEVEVRAKDILRIRFRAEAQDEFVSGTGFAPIYSKLAVFIKVGDTEYPTPLLHNGVDLPQQTSQIYNFSSLIPDDCDNDPDPLCRVTVSIIVHRPNYDFYCYNGITCLPTAHTQVYQTHPWNGTLQIETDDTVSF